MYKVLVSPRAREDLDEILSYIQEELGNPSAARSVTRKILARVKALEAFPLLGPSLSSVAEVAGDYRFLVCGNYLAFYRVAGQDVYVDRILYGSRNYLEILLGDITQLQDPHPPV